MVEHPEHGAAFATAAALGDRLRENGASRTELWVRIFKTGSKVSSVTWTDCVVEAIRVGSIDGRKQPLDKASFLQRLTPRKPGSNWSARNREHATRLIEAGRCRQPVWRMWRRRRRTAAGRPPTTVRATMAIPRDFLAALEGRPVAKAFFPTLDRNNRYPIYCRLHTAKRPETRARKMTQMLDQLDREEHFH